MKKLYDLQKAFFDRINAVEYVDKTHIDRIKDYCIGINKNVIDVINTLDWDPSKEHKTNSVLHQKVEAADAVVDIIKYAFNICHEYSIDYEDLIQKFQMKNKTIDSKFRQRLFIESDKFKNSKYAFIIDIDGVLADIGLAYRTWFGDKVQGGKFKTYDDFRMWRSANIDLYKELKEEYRLSGYKMIMPAVDNARDLLQECHKRGIVSLLTNRPVRAYPILYMYTIEWLFNRGMSQWVDMLHFTALGEKKYFFDRFEGKEVYFIEDNVYNLINTAERPNVCNIFVKNETNAHTDYSFYEPDECKPVDNLLEAITFIKECTDDKEDNNLSEAV
jgi:hypothetical protein